MLIVGHRGAAALAPENTVSSIRAALGCGVDAIEFDVGACADGRVVLLHDLTLDRTTNGSGLLAAHTWEEIRHLDAGSWFARRFESERPCDLDEALAVIGGVAPAIIEIKSDDPENRRVMARDRMTIDGVLAALDRSGITAGIVLSSANWSVLSAVQALRPSIPLALTVGIRNRTDSIRCARALKARELHVHRRRCSRAFVASARASGLKVLAYTVNDASELEGLRERGVDGVFSDDPPALRSPARPPEPTPAGRRRLARLRKRLVSWFHREQRDLPWRRTKDPYPIWISEVMLQQTQVATVLPYFERFLARFPDVAALAQASEEEVLSSWSGLGYYRRAISLRAGAQRIAQDHAGRIPADPAELRRIPGIGRYTAGAIASVAFGLPEPVVDGNVRRVLARLTARPGRGSFEEASLWSLAGVLARCPDPGGLNQALMELGAVVCTPRKPRCSTCPVGGMCRARKLGRPEAYPSARRSGPTVKVRVAAAVAISPRGRILLARRFDRTPFRGLWDLPALALRGNVDARAEIEKLLRARHGLSSFPLEAKGRAFHAIMNRRLDIEIFRYRTIAESRAREETGRWVSPDQLDQEAVSGATRKIMARAQILSQGATAPRSVSSLGLSGSGASARSKA